MLSCALNPGTPSSPTWSSLCPPFWLLDPLGLSFHWFLATIPSDYIMLVLWSFARLSLDRPHWGPRHDTEQKSYTDRIIRIFKGPQRTHRIPLRDNPDHQVLELTAHSLRLMPNCFTSSTSFYSPTPFWEVGTAGIPILPMRKLSLGGVSDDLLMITERVSDSAC